MEKEPVVYTAMVTPFDDQGELHLGRTERLVEHLLDNGTEGLVIAGTTGESPTLSKKEKINLFEKVVQIVNGRVPVIAATGSNNTAETIALTKEAESLGVDGVMLVTPYYNKPCQEGLYEHFASTAARTSLPIMLYNIPGRSVVHMTAETIIKLSQIDNIVSLKEASNDLTQLSYVAAQTPEDFKIYCGEDSLTLPMAALGADGVVSVASHVVGLEIKDMINAYNDGKVKRAQAIHSRYLPLMEALFLQPSPAPVKTALNLLGLSAGPVRLPLKNLSQQETKDLRELLPSLQL
ncbi:4-hydroxy-tetrahydrodipicolinate synthase [Lentibacillus sp. JNUCC-1]|uniref:4-hydroxy-tetrahydrodipicolinate synthase n=1 Tax=Lentibacillus sp. JNUCC-1 TaxID=2654513 RepID=UPI0012E74ACC|nr:4-hydroxy-tetrahydrodipicolinate synthase [Lentibacillus sp. JNUCC-1]MUV39905.1 4-hydroxy-tetrahydrodipicolinate synthase [Lentibacillus sp. JNUCC-1]